MTPVRTRHAGPAHAQTRVAPAAAVVVLAALAGGCGVLPSLPDPVPSDIVPSHPAAFAPRVGGGDLSPDGFDAVQRMAVRIRNVGCDGLSTGSGFALDEHTLVTNRHVVADSKDLQVSTYDGRDLGVSAAATARLADLAVVRTSDRLPSHPRVADTDPRRGDPVTVIGYPEGGRLTATAGSIIGSTTDPLHENLGKVLITDAPVEPGSSGSAALDAAGEVIGVVYAKTGDGDSLLVPRSTLSGLLGNASGFTPLPGCS